MYKIYLSYNKYIYIHILLLSMSSSQKGRVLHLLGPYRYAWAGTYRTHGHGLVLMSERNISIEKKRGRGPETKEQEKKRIRRGNEEKTKRKGRGKKDERKRTER